MVAFLLAWLIRDAGTGAAIGFVAPAVIQGIGKAGMAVYNACKGNKPGAGAMLTRLWV